MREVGQLPSTGMCKGITTPFTSLKSDQEAVMARTHYGGSMGMNRGITYGKGGGIPFCLPHTMCV